MEGRNFFGVLQHQHSETFQIFVKNCHTEIPLRTHIQHEEWYIGLLEQGEWHIVINLSVKLGDLNCVPPSTWNNSIPQNQAIMQATMFTSLTGIQYLIVMRQLRFKKTQWNKCTKLVSKYTYIKKEEKNTKRKKWLELICKADKISHLCWEA